MQVVHPGDPFADAIAAGKCGARTRSGTPCHQVAGFRTEHVGEGRCFLHGGLTPIKHGRYSLIPRQRIADLIELHEQDADPLNLLPELAALRALFQDYIERYEENREIAAAWFASFQLRRRPLPEDLLLALGNVIDEWENRLRETDDPSEAQLRDVANARKFLDVVRSHGQDGRPVQLLDLSSAASILAEIGKLVERIEKARALNAISRPNLNRIMQQMWRSVELRIEDTAVKSAIREDWLSIAL